GDHSASSDGRLPVRPGHHRSRGILDKGFPRERGVLRLHPDAGEKPPQWLLALKRGAQAYDQSQRSKSDHEWTPVDNTLGKKMGHRRRPDSVNRWLAANFLFHSADS